MSQWNKRKISILICFSLLGSLLGSLIVPPRPVASAQTTTDIVYDFEEGTTMGWNKGWGDGFTATDPLSVSQDLSVQGNSYSLKVNTDYAPLGGDSEWEEAALTLELAAPVGSYESVTYDVYVPVSFGGKFAVGTAMNGPWANLGFSERTISQTEKTTINNNDYVVIHETASIPAGLTQKQFVVQLAKNSALTYSGSLYLDNVRFKLRGEVVTPPTPGGSVTVVTYKDAVLNGYGVEKRGTPQDGDSLYAGDGYVSFFYSGDPSSTDVDGTATFNVNVDKADLYKLSVGYYIPSGYGSKVTGLVVNDMGVGGITLDAPAEGTVVNEKLASKVMLNAGTNTVKFTREWGYYGIEYIKVELANPPAVSSKMEAEDGIMTGDVTIGASGTGFSGTGYANFKQEGSLKLTYNATVAGMYDIAVGFSAPYGDKYTHMVVNGETSEVHFEPTTEFKEVSGGKAMLNIGENTIEFKPHWGWYNIDYVKLTPAAEAQAHDIESSLVNPNATPEARALINYMVDRYGKNIISGQQNLEEVEWIHEQTGKYPAIFSSDLIDYTPSRVERGASSTEVEKMIGWYQQGGIVALAWHWNAPKGLYDVPEKEWWRGFYEYATSFDVKYAMDNPDSEDYQLLVRDIDAIAVQLKRLQDANVPVLWRPLHEAQGGWFWWGSKGPEATKQLYHLMYDRLTNVHKLNNLIWVWNSENPEWYPGDDVVDIASVDIYNPEGDYNPSIAKYDSVVSLVNDKKVVALAENGPIPDPDLLQSYKADWSFFSTWSGHFIRDGKQNSLEHINKVYNSEYVITKDELPKDLYSSLKYEAENGTLTGVTVSTEENGYSGNGFVTGFDASGDNLRINAEVAVGGTYRVSIRYKTIGGSKVNTVSLNGEKLADYTFKETSEWKDAILGQYDLKAGMNTIDITNSWGWIDVDYIKISGGGGLLTHVDLNTEEGSSGPADVPVTLTGLANNAAEYRFLVKKSDGEWTDLNEYSKSFTYMWLPPAPGEYELKVFARQIGSSAEFQAVSTAIHYTVTPAYIGKPLVNPMFSSNMILQRDKDAEISGWQEPGTPVTVVIDDKTLTSTANSKGQWKVELGVYPAGGQHSITVTDGTETVTYTNVLFGDVYLASGQSNMAFKLSEATNAQSEISNANHSDIRFITIPEQTSRYPVPLIDSQAKWQVTTPDTAANLSAVGYFFARELNQKTGVPVGIIFSAVGGTKAENWTSYETLQTMPSLVQPSNDIRSGAVNMEIATSPTALYNGMIAPVAPYKLKGVLWYQGESNWGEHRHNQALPKLIEDWRSTFNNNQLTFTIFQISSYGTIQSEDNPAQDDGNPGLPVIREAQLNTVLNDNRTTLVVTTDVGNPADIHPTNKQDVGIRGAISVLGKFYNQPVVYSGPIYQSMTTTGNAITLSFDHKGTGLMAGVKTGLDPVQLDASGNLKGFAIAGSDGKFYWADARVEGDKVVVSSEQVSAPVAVRYNWNDSPIGNLYNKEGLPASPFRTDKVSYLYVEGGDVTGIHEVGEKITLTAAPPKPGMKFNKWVGDTKSIQDIKAASTFLIMTSAPYTEVAPSYVKEGETPPGQPVPNPGTDVTPQAPVAVAPPMPNLLLAPGLDTDIIKALDKALSTQAVQDAIEKISAIDVSKSIKVTGDKAKLELDPKPFVSLFKTVKDQADKLNAKLQAMDANAAKAKVIVTLDLGAQTLKNTEVLIPLSLVQQAKDAGVDKMAVKVNGVTLSVDVDQFKGDTTLVMDQLTPSTAAKATTLKVASDVYNFEFLDASNNPVTFTKPVIVKLPIANANGMNTNLLVLAKIVDNKLEFYGGKYNAVGKYFEGERKSFSTYVVVENKVEFSDTASVQAWAGKEIGYTAAKGIIQGKAAGLFAPNDKVTRAEFAAMIVKAFHLEDSSAVATYNDVKAGDWFASSVAAAAKAGIINGRTASTFEPNATISRAEMATLSARALEVVKGYKNTSETAAALAKFEDAASIHSSLSEGVALASSLGVVIGSNNRFNPDGLSTRAEAAVVIYRLLNL